jgi:N-acetylglucosaminyldiphosphoundecaprenol N-acetyl-beta-D-mannosaminyltransferase
MKVDTSYFTCMGYSLYTGDLKSLDSYGQTVINTINQYSFCIAERDPEFKKTLVQSDILLPDGIGIVMASNIINRKKIRKISGADAHESLLQKTNEKGGKCFYLGASDATLKKIEQRCNQDYPNITVGTYSPPFKKEFSKEDNEKMVKLINTFRPDVLFVGMTAPKQEMWVQGHKDILQTNIICSIGAVFDFYAHIVNRPSKIWRDLGLEWLGRLIKEPRRMWKRYLYFGPIFIYFIYLEKYKKQL